VNRFAVGQRLSGYRIEALLGRALLGHLDPAATVDAARVIFDAQAAALFRVSADRSELRAVSAVGIDAIPLMALDALAAGGGAHRRGAQSPFHLQRSRTGPDRR